MKGFMLDEQGDVIVKNGDIQMTSGSELLSEKIRQVLRTNRGEWWLNEKEGIPVQKVLKKDPDEGMVRDFIRSAVKQVDRRLEVNECRIKTRGRCLAVSFTVAGVDQETIAVDAEV